MAFEGIFDCSSHGVDSYPSCCYSNLTSTPLGGPAELKMAKNKILCVTSRNKRTIYSLIVVQEKHCCPLSPGLLCRCSFDEFIFMNLIPNGKHTVMMQASKTEKESRQSTLYDRFSHHVTFASDIYNDWINTVCVSWTKPSYPVQQCKYIYGSVCSSLSEIYL